MREIIIKTKMIMDVRINWKLIDKNKIYNKNKNKDFFSHS